MKISLIYNIDTRNENLNFGGENLKGVVHRDLWDFGLFNKIKYLDGFDKEVIVCVDLHNELPEDVLTYLKSASDVLLIRKHTSEPKFNDNNYVRAFSLASGDIVLKVDQDTICFASSPSFIQEQIDLLEQYDYISYPSQWSPRAHTASEYDYMWCSTRYMMYKRETLDLGELKKCLSDSDYLYSKYPASIQNPWTEHCIGLMAKYNGKGVYYPPIQENKGLIFSLASYDSYILRRLNELTYEEVKQWTMQRGIYYPNDVFAV